RRFQHVYVALLRPSLVPHVCDLHWFEAAVRLFVIRVDAQIQDPGGVALLAGVTDQRGLRSRRNFIAREMNADALRRTFDMAELFERLAAVERSFNIEHVVLVANAAMETGAQAG